MVGASLAGLRAVETLRKSGYDGRISILGDEPYPPYDRPPLSKDVLTEERQLDSLMFRSRETFDELDVELWTGRRATGLDLSTREVLIGEDRVAYDGLILSTGAFPRTLGGASRLEGVHTLRTLDDALAIRDILNRQPRVVVVGAGFIGSEVASSARRRGLDVTVVEALPVPLVGPVGPDMGAICASLHRDHGTRLICGVGVDSIEGKTRVQRVCLSDGRTIDADLVVIGVGVTPATGWLEGTGLPVRDGVLCDASLAAGPPGVYAAGDVARWPNPTFGMEMRIEHWSNAAEQGIHVARNLLAGDRARVFRSVPYFWSDQYGLRLQLVGHPMGSDMVHLCSGSTEERRFVALYRRGARLVAAFGMNSAREVMQYRLKIAQGIGWDCALALAEEGK